MSKLRDAIASDTPPIIPYLGMYLTEFIQIDEGNPSKTEEGLLNLVKYQLIARGLSKLQNWQKIPFCLQSVPQIQEFLTNIIMIDDEATLSSFSYYLEPKLGQEPPEIPPKLKEISSWKKTRKKNSGPKKKKRSVHGIFTCNGCRKP